MLDVRKVKINGEIFIVELYDRDKDKVYSLDVTITKDKSDIVACWHGETTFQYPEKMDDLFVDAVGSAVCYLETNYYIWQDNDYKWDYVDRSSSVFNLVK